MVEAFIRNVPCSCSHTFGVVTEPRGTMLLTPHPPYTHTLQVMDNVVPAMRRAQPGAQQVFRARFSAVSAPEVKAAMVSSSFS